MLGLLILGCGVVFATVVVGGTFRWQLIGATALLIVTAVFTAIEPKFDWPFVYGATLIMVATLVTLARVIKARFPDRW